MNLILKDTDFIATYFNMGAEKNQKDFSDDKIWLSQFIVLDFSDIDKYLINRLIKNKTISIFSFNEEELTKTVELYNKYKDHITLSDASAIIMSNLIEKSILINKNGIFKEICNQQKIKCYDYDWIFDYIKKARLI